MPGADARSTPGANEPRVPAAIEPFSFECLPSRVVFGAGRSRHELRAELERIGASRVLVIARAGRPLVEELVVPLANLLAGRFDQIRPHVPSEVAEAAIAAARSCQADCLLSIGGGSTTGAAKAVALATELPIVAVPTTYAGSEMTPVWGTTEGAMKRTGRARSVLPRTVIYDPELTYQLPADVTAGSGMNAIAHCVEALYAPGRNPVTALLALEAIRMLADALPVAVERPRDAASRSKALYGAHLAGRALCVAGSSLHHRICHALGGAYDLPHALTHSIVLPHVLAHLQPAAPRLMSDIAGALGPDADRSAAEGIYDLARRLGLPLALREVGMRSEAIEAVIPLVLEGVPDDVPRKVDADAVRAILRAAYDGERPATR